MSSRKKRPVFDGHAHTRKEAAGRAQVRADLVKLGLMMARGDERVVHHVDGNATNNAWSNIVVVNKCWHHILHSGTGCSAATREGPANVEDALPSFGFSGSDAEGWRPVPFPQWLERRQVNEKK